MATNATKWNSIRTCKRNIINIYQTCTHDEEINRSRECVTNVNCLIVNWNFKFSFHSHPVNVVSRVVYDCYIIYYVLWCLPSWCKKLLYWIQSNLIENSANHPIRVNFVGEISNFHLFKSLNVSCKEVSLFDHWLRHFEIELTSEKGGRMKNHIQQPLLFNIFYIFTFFLYIRREFWAVSKSTWWKMVTGRLHNGEKETRRIYTHKKSSKMKDNQIRFDFVLHEIIWFISQSHHIHPRVKKKTSLVSSLLSLCCVFPSTLELSFLWARSYYISQLNWQIWLLLCANDD